MKPSAFLILPIFFASVMLSTAQSPDPAETLKEAQRLNEEGHYQEAYDKVWPVLTTAATAANGAAPAVAADLMQAGLQALGSLGLAQTRLDEFLHGTLQAHPGNWRVLRLSAEWLLQSGGSHGSMIDGQFVRGQWGGQRADATARDRVQALRWIHEAGERVVLDADASPAQRAEVLITAAQLWINDRAAWQLQQLTDLSQLPEIEIVEEGRGQPGRRGWWWPPANDEPGYPVDAQGNIVFFKQPESWEAAANDGERWRFLLRRAADTDPAASSQATFLFAEQLSRWLDVGTLRHSPLWPRLTEPAGEGDDEAQIKQGIVDLPSLAENETITRLATGIKRHTLPEEFDYLGLLKELASGTSPSAAPALGLRARLFETRRQRDHAAEAWRVLLDRFPEDPLWRPVAESSLEQIRAPLGKLEPREPQPAGRPATIALVFRNATRVEFSARPVNVDALLDAARQEFRERSRGRAPSENREWNWLSQAFGSLLQGQFNLGERQIGRALGEPVAAWQHDLRPAPRHDDRRVTLDTPLRDAGIYLLEARFPEGNTARCLVEVTDLIAFTKPRDDGTAQLGFVMDALTGRPVASAQVSAFGYRQEYQERNNRSRQVWFVSEQRRRSDEAGAFALAQSRDRPFQWLLQVKAPDGRQAVMGLHHFYHQFTGDHDDSQQQKIFVVSDRPVYRPGQKVHLNAWARRATYEDGKSGNEFGGRRFTVEINDPRGEKLFSQQGQLDQDGAAEVDLTLSDNATLGAYFINWTVDGMAARGHLPFRVEEYKKPEFEVLVKTPEQPVRLGEAFTATVEARYYFGGAVTDAQVHYKVTRTRHDTHWFPARPWDWLYGPGYWWSTTEYGWLPGFRGCIAYPPPWWPRPGDPPEVVAEATVPIGPEGKVEIPIDTALARELHGDEDHRYQITAEVVDASRRQIVGTGSVIAPRQPYQVYVWTDRGFYQAGAQAVVSILARTPQGDPVKGKAVLRVMAVTYAENREPQEEEKARFELTIGDDQAARQSLTFPISGQYRLAVEFDDEAGHQVEGTAHTSARGPGFDGKGFRFPDLEIVMEKPEYAPGEEATFVINTDQEGGTLLVFERPRQGAYAKPRTLILSEGKSTTFKMPITSRDQPNIFLEVATVHGAKLHTQVVQVPVPPVRRIAEVALTPSQETCRPQTDGSVQVRITGADGRPVAGRVLLTGYDKALEYISGGSNIPAVRDFFWGWKRHHSVSGRSSLDTVNPLLPLDGLQWQPIGVFGNEMVAFPNNMGAGRRRGASGGSAIYGGGIVDFSAAAGIPSSGVFADAAAAPSPAAMLSKKPKNRQEGFDNGSDASEEATPLIRQDFADLLVWSATAKTDPDGLATLPFKTPDDLTTWKLRAWVLGPHSEVGEAQVEVICRKDLLVRLQAPRFFVEKDEVVLSGIVHNDLKEAQSVRAVLDLDGQTLGFMDDDAEQRREIPAGGEHRFDWRVKVLAEGQATVRVKALAAAESDAMEKTFPVFVHGMERQDAWSLALRADEAEGGVTFTVPERRRPAQTRLEVRYSPSLAAAMVDALPWLISYPHGCTEQTLNRFVPTVITGRVLTDLGLDLKAIRDKRAGLNAQELGDPRLRAAQWRRWKDQEPVFDAAELRKMSAAGLERLQSMQAADGGWGWWPGARQGTVHLTAQVVDGLLHAQAADERVPSRMLSRGVQWLEQHEQEQLRRLQLPKEDRHHKSAPGNEDALTHSVLVAAGKGEAAMRERLFNDRLTLSKSMQAALGAACHAKQETERRDTIVRNLEQFQRTDAANQTAWLDFGRDHRWWFWFDDEIETLAAYLRLRVTRDARDPIAPQLVKYLLNNRKHGTCWRSTRDTAAALGAFAAYLKATGETSPDLAVELWLDGQKLKEAVINKDNLFSGDHSLVLSGSELTAGEHRLEIRRRGRGPLYANVYLSCFTLEDHLRAAGLEVTVQRNLYKLVPEATQDVVAGSSGQALHQKGSRYRRERLPEDAALTSGDLIEVELIAESKNDYEYLMLEDFKPAGCEAIDLQSGYVWNQGLNAYREFRDAKVTWYIEHLPRGRHSLTYRLRAEIPGRFSALPGVLSGMYAPELKGNSEERKVSVAEAPR